MNNIAAQFENVIKRYDNVSVLKGVSGTIYQGEVIAMLGKNGAGKTTLMETLLGFAPSDSGNITVYGQTPIQFNGDVKHRIGYVPQEDDVLPHSQR